MAVESGAGAALASGAGYQARVAAYVVACAIAELPIPSLRYGRPSKMALETSEAVDDLQVSFTEGKRIFVQAKRSISFSTNSSSALYSVLTQFVSQTARSGPDESDEYCLVTSTNSSKRITGDMLSALEAARYCSPEVFLRDQPKSIIATYDELLQAVLRIQQQLRGLAEEEGARRLLAKSRVIVLDVDPNSSLEQAIVLALHSKGYAAPSEMWGKLISTCLEWARRRQTVDLANVANSYDHLRVRAAEAERTEQHQFLKMTFSAEGFEVGRELVAGRPLFDHPLLARGTVFIFEFYRFDDECCPRLRFESDRMILGSGGEVELWGRFSTWAGVERFIEENIERFRNEEVVFVPMNSCDDYESGLCAKTHRKALEAAALKRDGTKCVHCERSVTASMSPVVEFGEGEELTLGVSHKECLRPSDRVMGRADSTLFRENPELINFDVNAWFNAAHNAHGVFHSIGASKQAVAPVVWGGVATHEDVAGGYVVVSILEDGTEQITWKRGRVQRFTKPHADEFAANLRTSVERAKRDGDPLCYSDQSRAFGSRSLLLSLLGGKEAMGAIVSVVVRPFDAREAARFPTIRSWYAPLLVLREAETLQLVVLANAVPAISDPLALGRHLNNWRNAGFELPEYEIESLLTDSQVDQLIDDVTMTSPELGVIIDPILSEDGAEELIGGYPIYPLALMGQIHQSRTKLGE